MQTHTIDDLARMVPNGAKLALPVDYAGVSMVMTRPLIARGLRDLHVVCLPTGGMQPDMLIGAGCVATVETSHIGFGRNARLAVEAGGVRVVEHSGTTALDRFRAASLGLPLLPSKIALGTGPHVKPVTDPFTGQTWMAVEAIRPDVALIHAHASDSRGNIQLDAERWHDILPDVMIARSARTVIVSVEQVVSEQAVTSRPADTILSSRDVTCVVEAPYGAHPCGCDARYDEDLDHLGHYQQVSETPEGFTAYLDAHVRKPADHWAYLDAIGMRRLMDISTNRTHRP